jgi:uncharacterized protein
MNGEIDNLAGLEACIGRTPAAMHVKVIDHIDAGAQRWLAASPLMFAGFGTREGITISLGGGEPGFIGLVGASRLRVPTRFLDNSSLACKGQGFAGLFLVPVVGETLRINGHVTDVDDEAIEIAVGECYVHCAKSLIRSDFWCARPSPDAVSDPAKFLDASRFIALATIDSRGCADVSLKGDPAGTMIRLSGGSACFADRPGNRRADSFRNILTQPHVAMAVLIPGATSVLFVSGKARLTHDEDARAAFTVQGKVPLLVTCIEHPRIMLRESAALERARLWPVKAAAAAIDPAAIMVSHIKLSKERGLQAAIARTAVSVPGLMKRGLAYDYKTNLY